MQFRHLTFTAIGPFPGTHAINFDELTASGLFLFEGPTGAGKSSIIDALVYALYGDVAGRDSDRTRMRSTYADLSTDSSVDLIFTISSGTYRVRRTPARLKKKSRGSGTTSVPATAHLWKLSEAAVDAGEWDRGEMLATKVSHVDDELQAILGLSREQFVQTVVLPQGQFAQLLKMNSTDRAGLLETLFDTSTYREFTHRLGEAAKQAREEVDEAAAEAMRAVHSWLDIDGVAEKFPHLVGVVLDPEDAGSLELIAQAHAALKRECDAARAKREKIEATAQATARALQRAQELAMAIADRERLLEQRIALEERAPSIASASVQVAAHEAVSTVVEHLRREDLAREALAACVLPDAVPAVKAERDNLATLIASNVTGSHKSVSEAVDSVIDVTERKLGEVTAQLGALSELVTLEESLPQRRKDLTALDEQAEELDARVTELGAALETLPAEIAQIEASLAAERKVAAAKALIAEKLASQRGLLATAEKLADTSAQLAHAQAALQVALDADTAQRATLRQVTDAWRNSMASNLAGGLVLGHPCPVCGSTTHPEPATAGDHSATLEEVQAEEAVLDSLARKAEEANQRVISLKSSAQALRDQLDGTTEETIQKEMGELVCELDAASAAEANIARRSAQRAELESTLLHQREAMASAREDRRALCERRQNTAQALSKDEGKIASACASFASVRDRQTKLEEERVALLSLRTAATTVATRARILDEAMAASTLALADAGVTPDEAWAAYLAPAALAALRSDIDDYMAQRASVDAQLASERLQVDGVHVDLDAAQSAAERAQDALGQAHHCEALAAQRARDSHKKLHRLRVGHRAWKKVAEEAGPVIRLADLANAGSSSLNRIRLTVWVLLRRFEQIVERANEHLRAFSFGRYELRRADEGRGELKSGLGLDVIHHDAGPAGDHVRSPATLSGGETFYTSLALALALSEVVQAENGGIRIDTLIIDEGFGSLSNDYLQTVMDTLGQLRSSGRTVGIVSHVEELKAMIPDRVTIRTLSDGGSTLSVTA
ncbi:AAA family ATPase [Trueperella pyogenes]|uniref:AAA family ATPase n=1 Tax=Trueperella pyogenes TaxID=1661 RepID=UPI00345DFB7B